MYFHFIAEFYKPLKGGVTESYGNRLKVGKTIEAGEIVGWIGAEDENGGWPPHVHFQLSVKRPITHDMPGVVSEKERDQALLDYPHPFHVTGRLY